MESSCRALSIGIDIHVTDNVLAIFIEAGVLMYLAVSVAQDKEV